MNFVLLCLKELLSVLSCIQAISTQFISIILVMTIILKPAQFYLIYMSIKTATVIKSAATYWVICDLNNLEMIYNEDLIDITTDDITVQQIIH